MTATELLTTVTQTHYDGAMPISLPVGRTQMGAAFAAAGFRKGAEIGVWEGGFAVKLCSQNPRLELLCVDPWTSQPDYKEGKNDPARMEQAYKTARETLKPFPCTFLRMTSAEASKHVEDGSLDFAYLDGNHLFEHVLRDLQLWTPKLRKGGICAGHDYTSGKKTKSFIQVKPAVDQFTRERGISPWFILTGDKSASFMWVVA